MNPLPPAESAELLNGTTLPGGRYVEGLFGAR
jgi:hypothetical protein